MTSTGAFRVQLEPELLLQRRLEARGRGIGRRFGPIHPRLGRTVIRIHELEIELANEAGLVEYDATETRRQSPFG